MKETRFKQTDIGLVPEDWEVVRLGKLCKSCSYGVSAEAIPYNGKANYIRITDIDEISHRFCPTPLTSPAFYTDKHIVKEGDILIARTGASVGKHYIYSPNDGFLVFAGFLMRLHFDKEIASLLFYNMLTKPYADFIAQESMRTSQPGINIGQIKTYQISLPPLPERQRIAEVLGRVDELLVRLDKLIVKKQAVKQGTMQQLLTGRTRLDGFTAPWTYKKLQEMCAIIRNGINYTPARHGGLPVTRIETISNGYVDFNKVGYMQDAPRSDYRLQYGDILLSHINSLGNMGKNAFFDKDNLEIYHGMNLLLLRMNKSIDAKYIYYILNTHLSWQLFQDIAKPAVNQASISIHDISHITYCVPPSIAEQRAISRILTHMDKEIEALQVEQRKVENIKKGMMQQLLTGKIRLSV